MRSMLSMGFFAIVLGFIAYAYASYQRMDRAFQHPYVGPEPLIQKPTTLHNDNADDFQSEQ